MTQAVLRFAPSPNGRLHLGHAYSALLNERIARALDGRLLLRIEDIDVARCPPDLAAAMETDLGWLGFAFQAPVRRQSEHFSEYAAALEVLRARGLLYPCFCSRRDVADAVARREGEGGMALPRDPDGVPHYPGTCRALEGIEAARRIAAGEPHAWRLAMDRALAAAPGPHAYARFEEGGGTGAVRAEPGRWGDAVLARRDVPTSYHLAVVHDDALQGVTHVVRGRDLEAATDLHVLLQTLLGLPTPLYLHHDLVAGGDGRKLAKSLGSRSLADLRSEGATPETIRERLGFGQPLP